MIFISCRTRSVGPRTVALYLKQIPSHLVDVPITHTRQRRLDILQRLRHETLASLRIDIYSRRREQRLRKARQHPFVAASLLFAPAENFPVAARNLEPTFTSPVPFASTGAGGLVYAFDSGYAVAGQTLI